MKRCRSACEYKNSGSDDTSNPQKNDIGNIEVFSQTVFVSLCLYAGQTFAQV